jgi:hypothetical protein
VAKFEHKRYPALVLQDEKGIWARFEPEERSFGEHTVRVGVLETSNPALIKRLSACPDPELVRVDQGDDPTAPAA